MITFNFNHFVSYLMWDNETSEVICVISNPNPASNSGKLDRTDSIKEAIKDHFVCEEVFLPKEAIDVFAENEFTDLSVDTLEDGGQEAIREVRFTPITTY